MRTVGSARRVTIYLRPEDADLLEWVRRYTGAGSLSEAVAAALKELQSAVSRRRQEALAALFGVWSDAPQVDEAFRELEAGWSEWDRSREAS